MGRSWEERVAEYVDSPRLRQRLRVDQQISCAVDGNYGIYKTQASLKKGRKESSSCSCPSDYYPCKHVFALLQTYKNHPRSFLDLDLVMKKLSKREKPELLDLIRKMVLASPSSLSALGIKGFEEPERDYEEWR
ncbi:MAG: SWIM zinc finger family protein [archaeon]|nr:SWIM zinc finger family protein [archaeon]